MDGNVYTIYARGYPRVRADKDKRNHTWSPYQFVPFYIQKGQVLNIVVSGKTEENVFSVIGVPSDSENFSTYSLVEGNNTFSAKNDGVLSFTNHNESNDVFLEVKSSHQRIPSFELYKNSNEDWNNEMERYDNAPYVILSNRLSDIVVAYSSAKEYIKDVYNLMKNNELVINIQNSVAGLIENGRADYKLDNNRNLHLESNKYYMYATNEYTGYNRANGAMPQLLGFSNDRFGIWHENGHQRQQFPWQWSAGSGLTEVTVNIFSLFTQEQIMGRATNFDDHYSKMKAFLAKPVKSYDDADLFVKLGPFWQLRLAFTDQFYPQLFQLYRLMNDTPSQNEHHKQKQLFILTVSHLVNINLEPFFTMWGIYSDLNTLVQLSFLPTLTKPIWEYNNDNYIRLPIPEPKYIPELIYLKNSISNVVIKSDFISFTIDKDWYSPYHYVFMIRGKYFGEVKNGKVYYASSTLTSQGYKIERVLDESDGAPFTDDDILSIEVRHQGEYIAYFSSNRINTLFDDVCKIYVDDSFTSLSPATNQRTLDDLWQRYHQSKNEYTTFIKNKILLAQQLLLHETIKNDKRNETYYTVEFANASFKDYTYLARSSGQLLGELKNGQPVLSDTINGTAWKIPADRYKYEGIDIIAIFDGGEFLIRRVFWEDFALRNKIGYLSGDGDGRFDENNISQKDIDNLRNDILNSDLPYWTRMSLISDLDIIQQQYLTNTISHTYTSDKDVNIVFNDNTIFRNYRYMLMYDAGYISEVSYGNAYYSYLRNYTWVSKVTEEQLNSLYITAYVNDIWYTIYKFSDKTDRIIFDWP
ncbi:M60 family metallopeptidase [Klebsiella sp. BIGb0407]|uniref:M60 family metallopeptidase n=1 Tax=Klebsiella sp. BIGb0407 TaxID=2940603 RepID=UPI00216AA181|nr:M60 family metallopeptidase [Klebsiella sp. BIGb0407]MCS3431352.1 hypothetical protein [Klebsiella sp. BIGb0407]